VRSPKLEELRRRLLTSDPQSDAAGHTGEVFSPGPNRDERPPAVEIGHGTSMDDDLSAQSSTPPVPNTEGGHIVEVAPGKTFKPVACDTPRSLDGIVEAVSALFEPVRQCEKLLMEVAEASKSINQLARSAVQLCDPLKSFHDHMQRLSRSFESMRTFRDDLSELSESFAPVAALHVQIVRLSETVRTHLAQVANGLEPVKGLQVDILDLARALDVVCHLQDQFQVLSERFDEAASMDARIGRTRDSGA
jgi:hypothetical protein